MKKNLMNHSKQLVIFIILLGILVVTACALPCDLTRGFENKADNARKNSGTVTGKVCYPSESIPPMTLYFQSTLNGAVETLQTDADQATFSIDLEPGIYLAYAYPKDEVNYVIGGMYSEMVPCGLAVHCNDHTPIPVEVRNSETTSGVDICDWYAGAGRVPLPPDIQAPEIPDKKEPPELGATIKDARFTAYLELPDRLAVGEEVNLKFTLTNESDAPLYLLKWYTPLEGIGGEIFKITRDGQAVPYEGILASRSLPSIDSYVFLNPGESVSTVVDLGTAFDFSEAGTYQIGFISPWISHVAGSENELAKTDDDLGPVQILSNPVTLVIIEK